MKLRPVAQRLLPYITRPLPTAQEVLPTLGAVIAAEIRRNPWTGRLLAVACAIAMVATPGCPNMDDTEMPIDNTLEPTATVDVVSFRNNFEVSALETGFSVFYSVVTEAENAAVSGFYVPVADSTANAGAIGDRVVVATNLPVGIQQSFPFDPAASGVGFFRVGVIVQIGQAEPEIAESAGVIQVQGSPNPRFIQPIDAVTEVGAGDSVLITFDAGDPEGVVQWRLFFLGPEDARGLPPDQLGTQIQVGSGNIGNATFSTIGLEAGDYEVGLSTTDTGFSIGTTVANGDIDRIVSIPRTDPNTGQVTSGPIVRVTGETTSMPPTITFSNPGALPIEIFGDDTISIEFDVDIRETGATGVVDIFYDDDTNPNNRIFPIDLILPANTTQLDFDTSTIAEEGTYFIGASVRDGINERVDQYATGSLVLVRTATLTVLDPSASESIQPGSGVDAELVDVRWETNVPPSAGQVDVFALAIDMTGTTIGAELPLLAPSTTTVTSATFSNDTPGLYQIFVRITFTDGVTPAQVESAPALIRVSGLPTVLWLDELAGGNATIAGAIFEGVNPEDNAGGAFTRVDDLDGNGIDELLIVSRYGKPFFVNPSGIGPGEAYLIYGQSLRLSGEFNLNSVGTPMLQGVTLSGIFTVNNSDETEGISGVTLIPDTDGDSVGELVFGFPNTNSTSNARLEAAGQFLRGGVVILSSNNSILRNPDSGTPVIALGDVGQRFTNTIDAGTLNGIMADRFTFDGATCVAGTDGVLDTIVGPGTGFVSGLAPPRYEQLGFQLIAQGIASTNNCPTVFDVAGCFNPSPGNANPFVGMEAGSAFYSGAAMPIEPFGARILGSAVGDGFGTSVTTSNSLGDNSPGDLIITAPNRTATVGEFGTNAINSDISGSGVALLSRNRELWGMDSTFLNDEEPPTPHQYIMRVTSHCGDLRAPPLGQLSIAGDTNDGISNVIGIDDFNGDGRNDFAVGAPNAANGTGRVYIAFRREQALEGGFVLGKLKLDPTNAERLDGVMIVSNAPDALGSSLTSGVDLNGDGQSDLIIGSPQAGGGRGEVIVVFSDPNLISPINGITVQNLLSTRTAAGLPRAVRILGNALDPQGNFGFNVVDGGDVDNDGKRDLLIAAPGASPRFDPIPTDSIDALTQVGVDTNLDGFADNANDLTNAGLVFVLSGQNRLDQIAADPITGQIEISIDQLGTAGLRGYMIAGRRAGDRIGGGDGGDTIMGGISDKSGQGRSFGLAAAGDVDGDGRDDIAIGAILADPRRDPNTDIGTQNGGEAYLIYSTVNP